MEAFLSSIPGAIILLLVGFVFLVKGADFFVEGASYFRVQNIQLGYTFRNLGWVNSVRVSLTAQRPFTFFRYNGFTPEVGGSPIASGVDTSTYPMQGIYTLGLRMSF